MEINIKLNQNDIGQLKNKYLKKAAENRPKADYSTVEENTAFLQGYAIGIKTALQIIKNIF